MALAKISLKVEPRGQFATDVELEVARNGRGEPVKVGGCHKVCVGCLLDVDISDWIP